MSRKFIRLETVGYPNPEGCYTCKITRYNPRREHEHYISTARAQQVARLVDLTPEFDGGDIIASGFYGNSDVDYTSLVAEEQRINELEMWGPAGRPA